MQDSSVIICSSGERLEIGQIMDTTQRISTLCDADKRLMSPLLSEAAKWVTIRDLQFEYACHESVKAIAAVSDMFTQALEQSAKSMVELWDKIKETLQQPIEPLSKSFMADYRRAWRENHNNYRKLHALSLKRRPRCRWRPRESRRSLDGLSPQIVIVDELNGRSLNIDG